MKMRVKNGYVVDVAEFPVNVYGPALAAEFIDVPFEFKDKVAPNWTYNETTKALTPPPKVGEGIARPEPMDPALLKPTPPQFFLLFSAQERAVIRMISAQNLIIDDWLKILNDPRLTFVDLNLQSTIQGVYYLTTLVVPESLLPYYGTMDKATTILTLQRAAAILTGKPT